MIYTHSKVISIAIICLSLIVGVFIYNKNKDNKYSQQVETVSAEVSKQSEVDSDSDGLKDWEEALLGTDPNKNDSDGDGIIDSSESKENFVFNIESKDQNEIKPGSLTEEVSQKFFLNYLNEKKNNPDLTSDQIKSIADKATSDIIPESSPDFDIKDIKISKNQTKAQYEKEIYSALFGSSIKKQENELQIIEKVLQNGDKNELKKLEPIINSYQKVIDETLKITVPEENVGLHLVYLNTLNDLKDDISNMKYLIDDPIKSYAYINNYDINVKKVSIVMYKLIEYLNKP